MSKLKRIRDLTDCIATSKGREDDEWLQGQLERIMVRAESLNKDLEAEREKVRILRNALHGCREWHKRAEAERQQSAPILRDYLFHVGAAAEQVLAATEEANA